MNTKGISCQILEISERIIDASYSMSIINQNLVGMQISSPKIKKLCEKNAINQQLKISHTLGSKTLVRKCHEIRKFSREKIFSITHKKKDEIFVNKKAQPKNEISEGVSENEAYVKVFSKKNSSYVRGMGVGIHPSQVIRSSFRLRKFIQSATTSRSSRTEYQNLKLQVPLLQEQVADFESPAHIRLSSSASHKPQ
ncbi:hypothetical protein Ahy_B01g057031 [Arachis hypogaea]|uniref:Uncharacterized protein n=1 Tax=Arachis hypogaea TaxID=3818 RepID=A0A445B026_ARAHY|nr:hypothetical protein Ahy_B01g057031 [Arachis hypogaea]